MDKVTGPLSPRRAIATAIRQLREERRKLLNDRRDIEDLIVYYEIAGTDLASRLAEWTEAAQGLGWWTDFDDEVLATLDMYLAYEVDVTVERVYTLPFVPALLQTVEYAQAVFRDMERRPENQIDQLLQIRLRRQEALRRRHKPLRLVAVTHESTLRQVVGSPRIMRAQLDQLVERSAAQNVTLRVLPFAAKPIFSMTCMYAYFEYEDVGMPDIVNIETHAGFFTVDDAYQVEKYRAAHDSLVHASLSEDDSRKLITDIGRKIPGALWPKAARQQVRRV
jgi:hypothetical protein